MSETDKQWSRKSSYRNRSLLYVFFFVPFGMYLWTMAPGIVEGDSAELVGSAHFLGVAHLGYPLYALLGKSISLFLPIGTIAYRCNILSVLLTSGMVVLVWVLVHTIFNIRLPALVALFFIPFMVQIWQQAGTAEVYSLQLFLAFGWLLVLLSRRHEDGPCLRRTVLLWFIFGLALVSHHSTLVWGLPLLMYWVGSRPGRKSGQGRWSSLNPLFFGIALSLYVYIPLRAMQGNPWNWNYPDNWRGVLELLSGYSFRNAVILSKPGGEVIFRFQEYWLQFWDQLGPVFIVLGVAGLMYLMVHRPRVAGIFFGFLLSDLCYCLFFNQAPLEVTPFGLISKILLLIAALIIIEQGTLLLRNRFPGRSDFVLLGVLTIYLISWIGHGYRHCQYHDKTGTQDFVFNCATSVEAGSRLICEKDEIFPLLYAQTVERDLTGIVILHYLHFQFPNEWSIRVLRDLYPRELLRIVPFVVSSSGLDPLAAMRAMSNSESEPVYVTFPDFIGQPQASPVTVRGLLYGLTRGIQEGQSTWPMYRIRKSTKWSELLKNKYHVAYFASGLTHFEQADYNQAERYWLQALDLDANNGRILRYLALISLQRGDREKTQVYLKKLQNLGYLTGLEH